MIVFPNCKINLGLHILRKRSDGYHDIETFFYPVHITDALEIIPSKNEEYPLQFSTSGITINESPDLNLCSKAYFILKKDFPSLPSVLIHLHKTIPLGAGLGGGSADAAFKLKVLNKMGNLKLTNEKLMAYALSLGSDCPFFIINKPCFASGRGENLVEHPIDLSDYQIAIVNPGIHVNTGNAFSTITPAVPQRALKEILAMPVNQWKDHLINDFEQVVFRLHKEIEDIKYKLYSMGAIYASMSGSGSSVYGIFEKKIPINNSFPTHYFVKMV